MIKGEKGQPERDFSSSVSTQPSSRTTWKPLSPRPKPLPDGCGLKKSVRHKRLMRHKGTFSLSKRNGETTFRFHSPWPPRTARPWSGQCCGVSCQRAVRNESTPRRTPACRKQCSRREPFARRPEDGCARTYRSRFCAFSVAGDGNILGLAFLAGYCLMSNHLHLIGNGELFRSRVCEVWGGGNLRAQPIATRCALAVSLFRAERPAAKKVCTW